MNRIISKPHDMQPQNIYPNHIAIIIDGNGRWAEAKGKPRSYGHEAGTKKLHEIVRISANLNINYLTIYAFSTENWQRPVNEVNSLMDLFKIGLDINNFLNKNNIKLLISGKTDGLPEKVSSHLEECIEATCNNAGMTLCIALNYSSRHEILNSAKKIAEKIEKKYLKPDEISEEVFSEHLYTPSMPDIDYLIRTGGEYRLSNFMLWQCSYAEFYFTPVLWPDFEEKDFHNALLEYNTRDRRFGKVY